MIKFIKYSLVFIAIFLLFGIGTLVADKMYLQNELIRIHVVGRSNSREDQNVKLAVKDAINAYLSEVLDSTISCEQASIEINRALPQITAIATEVLNHYDRDDDLQISLSKEAFPSRNYDTFTLPSGVYQSLRICIGDASGNNWWCVAFPSLCEAISSEEFCATAVDAGMSEGLSRTIVNDNGLEIRFALLDFMGKLENFFVNLMS